MERVAVKDLYVQCSLRVRNFDAWGLAMSDCCRKSATSVVLLEEGKQMYRCEDHRGVVAIAPSSDTVYRKVED